LSEAQPFVVAITVERFKTDTEMAALSPRQLAELAFHKVNPKVRPGERAREYARRLSQKAIELEPNDPEARRWRAEMLHRLGEEEAALAEVQKSMELSPDSADAWRLKMEVLSKLKKYDAVPAAQSELRRHELRSLIPPRDPNARPNLVDLSAYYNVALNEDPHWQMGVPLPGFGRLSQAPRGIQMFSGIEFDVRGFVQLNGAQLELRANRLTTPREVDHIKVGQRARKLHFLHGTGWADPDGTVIGRYIIHFANGEQRQVPIILGADMYDWVLSSARRNQPASSASKLAWRGPNPNGLDHDLGVYVKTWDNPLPDVVISQIDFVSEMHDAAPFLIALTVE